MSTTIRSLEVALTDLKKALELDPKLDAVNDALKKLAS